jgi:glycerol dehydrogenase
MEEMDWLKPQLPFVWKAPALYIQGPDSSKDTGKYCGHLGKKAFIMGGNTALNITQEGVENSLSENGVEVSGVYPGVSLCSDAEIDKVTEAAKTSEADFIIGIGGGSVADVARMVANNVGLGGKLVMVGTVASMAGHTSALSVIYNDDLTWNRYELFPEDTHAVIVDSKLVAKGPVDQTVNGMGDTLCIKWEMEAHKRAETPTLVGGYSTVTSRLIADECWNQLKTYGVQAVAANKRGVVTPALERIIETNTLMAGVGFESGGLAGGHGIHDGLIGAGFTALHRMAEKFIPHGQVISFTTITQLILEDRPAETVQEVIDFSQSVGLATTFEDLLGKGRDVDLDVLWNGACKACNTDKVLLLGATPVSPARVYSALVTADELGQKSKDEKGI